MDFSTSDRVSDFLRLAGTWWQRGHPSQPQRRARGIQLMTRALVGILVGIRLGASSVAQNIDQIQHIVFIIKENRSFDNYFGTFPGANGATSGTISTGQVIPLGHTPDRVRDMGHTYQDAVTSIDGGKMDRFDVGVQFCNENGDYMCYSQMQQSDIPNYWTYAQTFALADNMFSSLEGPSFPNHLYTVAAQSGGAVNNPITDKNVGTLRNTSRGWGCDVPNQQVQVKGSDGSISLQEACFNFQTLADEL